MKNDGMTRAWRRGMTPLPRHDQVISSCPAQPASFRHVVIPT
jgi:hypothetical protein